jgi:hypothetical protein
MTRRRTESNPVSLFPFLAVLLSAMGALILLLVVVSRQAQRSRDLEYASAAAQARGELAPLPDRIQYPSIAPVDQVDWPPVDPPDLPPLPEIKDPRPDLLKAKQDLQAELRSISTPAPTNNADEVGRRDRLSELQDRLRALEEEIRRIEEAKALAEKQKTQAESTARELDARWSKAKATPEKQETRFSIVPYFGPNGSDREPIYLECRKGRIILQPAGVEITPDLLGNPLHPDNTLATLLRGLLTHSRAQGEQPYPLLVVRPDGIETYYIARMAVSPIRVEYGYELVPKDASLDFGTTDPKTQEIALAIVADAKRRSGRPAGSGLENDWDFDVASEGPGEGPTTVRDLRTMRSPTRAELESLARGLPMVGGPLGGNDSRRSSPANSPDETPLPVGDDVGEPPLSLGSPTGLPTGTPNGPDLAQSVQGSAQESRRPSPAGEAEGANGAEIAGDDPDSLGSTSNSRGPRESATPEPPLGPSAADRLGDLGVPRRLSPAARGGWSAPNQPNPGSLARNDRAGSSEARSPLSTGRPGESAPGSRSATEPRSARADGPSGPRPSSNAQAGKGSRSAASGARSTQSSQAGGNVTAGEPGEFEKAMQQAAGGGSSSAEMPDPSSMPMPSLTMRAKDPSKPSSKKPVPDESAEGGSSEDDGNPILGPTGSIRETLRRSVVVECRDAGVTLYPGGEFIKFDPSGDMTTARQAIYKHVAEQMLSWGPASEIHRWAPVVEFNVRPDGLDRYYDLRLSMTSSGLEVRRRLLSWKDDVDFSEVFGGKRPADQARRRSSDSVTR